MTKNEASAAESFDKKHEKVGVQPLFPALVHISLAVIAVVAMLLRLWPASAIRGWSFRLPLTLGCIIFLSFYVAGEMVRWRFRVTLKNMFALVALSALVCGGFGAWLHDAHQQRKRVLAIQQLGGHVGYDTVHGLDGKFVTSDGWVVPQDLVGMLGVDFFARTKSAGWFNASISDAQLLTLNLQGFSSLSISNPKITDAGLAHVCQNREVKMLWLGSTSVTDEGLGVIRNLPQLQHLNLYNTGVSDNCLHTILALQDLEHANLRKTRFTRQGIEELRRMLPDCQVLSDFDERSE